MRTLYAVDEAVAGLASDCGVSGAWRCGGFGLAGVASVMRPGYGRMAGD